MGNLVWISLFFFSWKRKYDKGYFDFSLLSKLKRNIQLCLLYMLYTVTAYMFYDPKTVLLDSSDSWSRGDYSFALTKSRKANETYQSIIFTGSCYSKINTSTSFKSQRGSNKKIINKKCSESNENIHKNKMFSSIFSRKKSNCQQLYCWDFTSVPCINARSVITFKKFTLEYLWFWLDVLGANQ